MIPFQPSPSAAPSNSVTQMIHGLAYRVRPVASRHESDDPDHAPRRQKTIDVDELDLSHHVSSQSSKST
ncbi:MAG: hypothetical protein AAF539_01815 [Planctomycetota bacterium]